MIPVAVTQRVEVVGDYNERRDALDQRWADFLRCAGLLAIPAPNHPELALELAEATGVRGLVLTGGNDLAPYGGDAPERDATELALLDRAGQRRWPVFGVCRGMQMVLHRFGVELEAVSGHVKGQQEIEIDGRRQTVNSFHRYGARSSVPELQVWARADDGVIKAVRHVTLPIAAVMWHPERMDPFREADVALVARHFGAAP